MTFVNSTKTPSNGTLLRRTSSEVFVMLVVVLIHCCSCDVGCCASFIAVFVMLVVVLHSLLFDVIPHLSVSYRWIFTLILYFQSSLSQSDSQHFHLNLSGHFFHSFTTSATILRGYFFTHRLFFTLGSFPTFLPQPAFIKASLGAGSSFLKFAWLYTDDPWNTDPVHLFVWFTAIHDLDIQKNSYLNRVKYYHELLVVKSLVYLLRPRFKLFSLVQSICKDYKKCFEQDLYYL